MRADSFQRGKPEIRVAGPTQDGGAYIAIQFGDDNIGLHMASLEEAIDLGREIMRKGLELRPQPAFLCDGCSSPIAQADCFSVRPPMIFCQECAKKRDGEKIAEETEATLWKQLWKPQPLTKGGPP